MKADDRIHLLNNDVEYIRTSLDSLVDNARRFYQETNQHEMVKAFHKKFRVAMPEAPTFDFPVDFRINLIEEELEELKAAIANADMPEFVDAICDLLYVVHSMALVAGIQHIQPFFEEVHATNMAKEPYNEVAAEEQRHKGKIIPRGKILKPEGWQPPRIAELLAERYGR